MLRASAIACFLALTGTAMPSRRPVAKLDRISPVKSPRSVRRLAAAATAKKRGGAPSFYTDDFTHTHTSGKVDGRDARIVSLIAAETNCRDWPTKEFDLSCFGEAVCIARALSRSREGSDGGVRCSLDADLCEDQPAGK